MKHYSPFARIMAIAIASTIMTACSLDSYEPEKPFTTCPVENARLYACGISPSETRTAGDAQNMLFTEKDIEWFDPVTRELRFRDMEEPLYEKLRLLSGVEFRLGDQTLFSGSTFVGLICSQVFNDLVLCCGKIEDGRVIDSNRYYLYDCYPPQFIDTDKVKANRELRAPQWEAFLKYLESKGKLRK